MAERVMIVGAGLAGSLLACMLARRGFRVDVHERRPDPRRAGFVGGRSINLALSTRGIHALRAVDLADRVLADAIPMRGRMMHDTAGHTSFQRYSGNPEDAINSVSRGGLNITLLDAADVHENVTLHFNQRCLDVDLERPAATFHDETTGESHTVETDLIFGTDGAFSAVRTAMQKTDRFDYCQDYLEHGYKELHIPPSASGDFALEPNALHIWPRGGSMMIALPNADRSFTCTLFWPFVGEHGFSALRSGEDIQPFFERHYPDAVPLMPTLVDDYRTNPTSSLVTIRCRPWAHKGRVLILGDAAHAIVPFYGQGMNAAFEDGAILDEMIGRAQSRGRTVDWAELFARFSRQRKPDADAIADLALENFIEMRDRVASPSFRLRKRVDNALHRLMPHTFVPLYNMVSFTRIPYAEARRRAQRQRRLVRIAAGALLLLVLAALIALIVAAW